MKPPLPLKTCPVCGGEFTPCSTRQVYCGPHCRRRAKKRRERKAGKRPNYVRDSTGRDVDKPNGRFCRFPGCGCALYGGHWYYCPLHWRLVQEGADWLDDDLG